ncbi:EF-hand calcium-binding domain-containing protein 11 [Anthophora plagiata]
MTTRYIFKDRAKTAFNYAAVDSGGSLSKREYKVAMAAVFGCPPEKAEVKQVFQSTDRILYEEFEQWVIKKSVANDSRVNAEILFSLLDSNYKGYLVLDDFVSASLSVDLKIKSSLWQTVFEGLDRYRRGYIAFDEFLRVLPAV